MRRRARLAEGAERDALIDRLIEVFALSRPRASADVVAFLAQLSEEELLE